MSATNEAGRAIADALDDPQVHVSGGAMVMQPELLEALGWAAEVIADGGEPSWSTNDRARFRTLALAARKVQVPQRGEVAVICGPGMEITSEVRHSTGSLQVTCKATAEYAAQLAQERVDAGEPPARRRTR